LIIEHLSDTCNVCVFALLCFESSLFLLFFFSFFFFAPLVDKTSGMSDEDEIVDILNDSPVDVASKRQKSSVQSQEVPQEVEEEEEDEEEEEEEAPRRKVSAAKKNADQNSGPKRRRGPAKSKKLKAAEEDDFEENEEDDEPVVGNNDDNDSDGVAKVKNTRGGGKKVFQKISSSVPSSKNSSLKNEGIIERIHLVNFMNHANLEVDLGPQINFITGPNGAGKSAILVGLSLGLGANTSFAQRSSKLGDFVRTGSQKAIISVKLRNVGEDTFKPELYGASITVERTITATGSTTYKFKDHAGKVVSTDRTELVPMCDRFNIQINNPCIIMMQETSRDFLGTSTPKKKYELFERATQIKAKQNKKVGTFISLTNNENQTNTGYSRSFE
jgi:hypothetical protein